MKQGEQIALVKKHIVWEIYSIGSNPPEKETTCLKILIRLSSLILLQLSIKKTSVKGKNFVHIKDSLV